ncbi:MAG: hypothetical protein WA974_03750 [Thermodesulfobacteriota bacterium]
MIRTHIRDHSAGMSVGGPLMAGALISSLPVAVVYTFFLDRFISGFTMGSIDVGFSVIFG